MAYQIARSFRFEAAHLLPFHQGKCARLHGHTWYGEVEVYSTRTKESGPEAGMVMDFAALDALLKPLVDEYLDHRFLNESLGAGGDVGVINPTSEMVARWLARTVAPLLPEGVVLSRVVIEETPKSRCVYFPE